MSDLRHPIQIEIVSDTTAEGAQTSFPAGSTHPPLDVTLVGADGSPVDLTDAVRAVLRLDQRGERVVEAPMDFTDREAGRLRYRWADRDVAEAGTLQGRITVQYRDGRTLKAPTQTRLVVRLTD